VGELMPQHGERIACIRRGIVSLHDDAPRVGEREGRSPFWCASARPFAKPPRVGSDGNQNVLRRPREPWKAVSRERAIQQRGTQLCVAGKADDGDTPAIDPRRRVLGVERKPLRGERKEEQKRQTTTLLRSTRNAPRSAHAAP